MYSFVIFSLIGVAVSISLVKQEEVIENKGWQTWKFVHHKKYNDFDEEKLRFAIWEDNFRRISDYNKKSSSVTWYFPLQLIGEQKKW